MNNEEISVLIRPASRTGAPEFSLPIHFLYYRLPYRLARPVLERWPYFQSIGGFHEISGDTNNNHEQMLLDKQNELMSDLLFTVHQHGGDDVT